jgi:hypothetical protein
MNMNMDPNAMNGPWFTPPSQSYEPHQGYNMTPPHFATGMSPPNSSNGYYNNSNMGTIGGDFEDEGFENEPPLLEELGINFQHIWIKTQSVLIPTKKINEHILDDADLAGPLVFGFIFGMCLLLVST